MKNGVWVEKEREELVGCVGARVHGCMGVFVVCGVWVQWAMHCTAVDAEQRKEGTKMAVCAPQVQRQLVIPAFFPSLISSSGGPRSANHSAVGAGARGVAICRRQNGFFKNFIKSFTTHVEVNPKGKCSRIAARTAVGHWGPHGRECHGAIVAYFQPGNEPPFRSSECPTPESILTKVIRS